MQIEAKQRLLIQFAEEKLHLANQAFELVDVHLAQVDKDVEMLERELEVCSGFATLYACATLQCT